MNNTVGRMFQDPCIIMPDGKAFSSEKNWSDVFLDKIDEFSKLAEAVSAKKSALGGSRILLRFNFIVSQGLLSTGLG